MKKRKLFAISTIFIIIITLIACKENTKTTVVNTSTPSSLVSLTTIAEITTVKDTDSFTTTVTTPDIETAEEYLNHYNGIFSDFVKRQELPTELIPIMQRALQYYPGLVGLSANGYPSMFEKGADGIYRGFIDNNKNQQLSMDQTIDLISEVFDRQFIEPKFYDFYIYQASDDTYYHNDCMGNDPSYHGHYFKLMSKTDDTIKFKCICLCDADPNESYSIDFDEDRSKWLIDYYRKYDSIIHENIKDYTDKGKVYEPMSETKEYLFTLKIIDGKWKFTQFELWN